MVAIIKYNAGNVQSVQYALQRLGVNSIVTDEEEKIRSAEKIIFPGVGNAGSAMVYLKERKLDIVIRELKQPVLGICLGLQLLCNHTEEDKTKCLGIFDTDVKLFKNTNGSNLKIPQIGWNAFNDFEGPLFKGCDEPLHVYFVHSYFAGICDSTIAKTNYIQPYSSALQKDNFFAVQFHTEKSGPVGDKILKNFLSQ